MEKLFRVIWVTLTILTMVIMPFATQFSPNGQWDGSALVSQAACAPNEVIAGNGACVPKGAENPPKTNCATNEVVAANGACVPKGATTPPKANCLPSEVVAASGACIPATAASQSPANVKPLDLSGKPVPSYVGNTTPLGSDGKPIPTFKVAATQAVDATGKPVPDAAVANKCVGPECSQIPTQAIVSQQSAIILYALPDGVRAGDTTIVSYGFTQQSLTNCQATSNPTDPVWDKLIPATEVLTNLDRSFELSPIPQPQVTLGPTDLDLSKVFNTNDPLSPIPLSEIGPILENLDSSTLPGIVPVTAPTTSTGTSPSTTKGPSALLPFNFIEKAHAQQFVTGKNIIPHNKNGAATGIIAIFKVLRLDGKTYTAYTTVARMIYANGGLPKEDRAAFELQPGEKLVPFKPEEFVDFNYVRQPDVFSKKDKNGNVSVLYLGFRPKGTAVPFAEAVPYSGKNFIILYIRDHTTHAINARLFGGSEMEAIENAYRERGIPGVRGIMEGEFGLNPEDGIVPIPAKEYYDDNSESAYTFGYGIQEPGVDQNGNAPFMRYNNYEVSKEERELEGHPLKLANPSDETTDPKTGEKKEESTQPTQPAEEHDSRISLDTTVTVHPVRVSPLKQTTVYSISCVDSLQRTVTASATVKVNNPAATKFKKQGTYLTDIIGITDLDTPSKFIPSTNTPSGTSISYQFASDISGFTKYSAPVSATGTPAAVDLTKIPELQGATAFKVRAVLASTGTATPRLNNFQITYKPKDTKVAPTITSLPPALATGKTDTGEQAVLTAQDFTLTAKTICEQQPKNVLTWQQPRRPAGDAVTVTYRVFETTGGVSSSKGLGDVLTDSEKRPLGEVDYYSVQALFWKDKTQSELIAYANSDEIRYVTPSCGQNLTTLKQAATPTTPAFTVTQKGTFSLTAQIVCGGSLPVNKLTWTKPATATTDKATSVNYQVILDQKYDPIGRANYSSNVPPNTDLSFQEQSAAGSTHTYYVAAKWSPQGSTTQKTEKSDFIKVTSTCSSVSTAPTKTTPAASSTTIPAAVLSPTITAVKVKDGTVKDTAATIEWTTDQSSTSFVDYGPATGYDKAKYEASTGSETKVSPTHTVELKNLIPATQYFFRVRSTSTQGVVNASPDMTFTTVKSTTPAPAVKVSPSETPVLSTTLKVTSQACTIQTQGIFGPPPPIQIPTTNPMVLSWDSVASATSYQILYATGDVAEANLTTLTTVSATTYTDANAARSTKYTYQVKALSAAGTTLATSNRVVATNCN